MRTDCRLDKKQVTCPNASLIGYGKPKAQVGDLVSFSDQGSLYVGRMIARIAYAPALKGDSGPIRNWILCAYLGTSLSYVGERWVNPENVTLVKPVRKEHHDALNWFLSDDMTKQNTDMVRLCVSNLWSCWDKFVEWRTPIHGSKGVK